MLAELYLARDSARQRHQSIQLVITNAAVLEGYHVNHTVERLSILKCEFLVELFGFFLQQLVLSLAEPDI